MTPQFIASRRLTGSEPVTAMIGLWGRNFEMLRAVKPVSVSAMIAAAPM